MSRVRSLLRPPAGVEGAGARPGPLWRVVVVFAVGVIVVATALLRSPVALGLGFEWATTAILTVAFYLVFAVSGQFSFATGGLYGLGAYAAAWAASESLPFPVGLVSAVLVVGAVSALIALGFRKAGHYTFAVATLAVTQILLIVFRDHLWFGGPGGDVVGIPSVSVFGLEADSPTATFYLAFAALVLAVAVVGAIERSPVHSKVIATRDASNVAASLGIDPLSAKVGAFVIGGALCAVAGVLFAHRPPGVVSPGSFSMDLAISVFLALLLGGRSSMWGSIAGAAFVVWVPELLRDSGPWREVFYGCLLILVVLGLPTGLVGIARPLISRRSRSETESAGGVGPDAGGSDRSHPLPATSGIGRANSSEQVVDLAKVVAARSGHPRLEVTDVSVSFGGVHACSGVDVGVAGGEILGIVGPNGSGKSTLLNAISGMVSRTGRVHVDGKLLEPSRPGLAKRAGVGRAFQTPQVFGTLSVERNVALGDDDTDRTGWLSALFVRRRAAKLDRARLVRARQALKSVGLDGLGSEAGNSLAYGQRKLLELARLEVASSGVVLLDEPTAGLTDAETAEVVTIIRRFAARGAAVVVVDHKIDLLNDLCDRLLVLAAGEVVVEGSSEEIWNDERVIDVYLGA